MEGSLKPPPLKKPTKVAEFLTMQKLKNRSKNVLILRDHSRNIPLAISTADPYKSPTILAVSTERVLQFVGTGVSEKLLLADLLDAPCDLEELHAYLCQDNSSVNNKYTPPLLLRMKDKTFIWVEKMLGKDAELLELLSEAGTLELTGNELVQVVNSLIITNYGEETTNSRISPRDVQRVDCLENNHYGELSFDEVFERKEEDAYYEPQKNHVVMGDSKDYEPGYDFEQYDLTVHFSPAEKLFDLDLLMGKSTRRK